MKLAKIVMAGAAAIITIHSTALAQQTATGMVTRINRINGTLAIQQTQNGTVGANTGGTAEEFKIQDASLLSTLHAGDKVSFSAAGTDGIKTITKLEKQKQ